MFTPKHDLSSPVNPGIYAAFQHRANQHTFTLTDEKGNLLSPTPATHSENFDDLQPATRTQAKRGGGPKTDEGKARSSENRTSHGCCSSRLILPGEDPEEYAQLKEGWFSDYDPCAFANHTLTMQVVNMHWFLLRNQRRCDEVELALSEKSPLDWTDQDHRNLARFMRYRTAAERSFHKSFAALEKYRSTRIRECQSEERLHLRRENTRSLIEARLGKALPPGNKPPEVGEPLIHRAEVPESNPTVYQTSDTDTRHRMAQPARPDILEAASSCPSPFNSHQPFLL